MAFAGGAADKVGNEYETWWTLRRVTQLLRGHIDAMAVEPLGGDGAELWVEAKGVRTYDQVKFRSSGRWTPSRLRSDGILAKLRRHYAAGCQVLLVLSQSSEELERLIALAAATSSGEELWGAAENSNDLNLLSDAWSGGKEETRAYLLQTSVRHDGLPHLKEFVELTLETLVIGNANFAVGVLRNFLEARVTTTFTAPQVWAALESAGLAPRPRLEPGPTISRLSDALAQYARAVRSSVPSAGTIHRREVGEIIEKIGASDSPILLVVGKAGAGKSVVVADAAEELARSGRHVAAVRLDRLNPNTSTAAQVGTAMDLERSPVISLSEVSPDGFDGVLVIDQLDAVSNYSGRMPAVYEAVDEALTQARLLGNVRVILAVRSIDLEEDPRLRKLAGQNVPIVEVGELDPDDVRSYLAQIGMDVSRLNSSTLQLLRLPIHLYVFSELDPTMRSVPYATLTSLYGAFTRSFRTRLELAGYPDEWPEVSRVLVERMNMDEALTVPAVALEHIRPLYVEALISANVLIRDEGRLALFHETYFDYLFAKSFAQRGQHLVHWFATTGQGLFRRSQLRQLLAYIGTEERAEFISQISAIADSKLRPHLVSIAYTILGDYSPAFTDWIAIRRLASTDNPFKLRVIALIGGPKWFAAADAAGDVDRLLDDPEWQEILPGLVAGLAGDVPERVLELLRPRQQKGDAWVKALRSALEVSDSPVWAAFALEQIMIGGLDLPDQPFDVLESSFFHRLIGPHPVDALHLMTATLTHDIDRQILEGNAGLDNLLARRGRNFAEAGQIEQLASDTGGEFVETTLPLIEKIATYAPSDGRQMWRYRIRSRHSDLGEDLFNAFDEALTRLTRTHPDQAIPLLERLSNHHLEALDFLVCRALCEAPGDRGADWILESQEHRDIGWMSDIRWESRRLIEHASRTCSDDRFTSLESSILYWDHEYQDPASKLRWSGLAELELLSALAADRLGRSAKRRIAELRRKFEWWEPKEPEGISGGTVQSPISRPNAERMTNSHWIRAIEKYKDVDRTTFRDGDAFGGTHELASMMGALAKDNPGRFLSFALTFPATTPATYTEHVIRNLAGETGQLELLPLLRKFRTDHPADSGRAVVSAIDEHAGDLADQLFEELLVLAEDPDPTREFAREPTGSGFYFGGDLVSAGINSTRGQAANTLARVIFANHSRLQPSLGVLQHLVVDPIAAVRSLTTEAVLAYASISREDGLNLLARLLDDDLVLTSSSALRALRWAMLWDADRFGTFLIRALDAEDAKLAGAIWANCAVNGALGSVPGDVMTLSESARIGVAEAIAPDPGLGIALLTSLFEDRSIEVRRQAGRSMHYLKDMADSKRGELILRFVESAAFDGATDDLLDAIEELPGELPPITWEVCRRAIDVIAVSSPRGIGVLTGNLVAILVRLYRASNEAGREAALDLIDQTVLLQLWRVDQALDDAR
ncbi:ATP-binding protein [Subtercola frigoramans]|uniref:ATP-binding protein n=1 Tax=Subtercola frigoramans TaxID=120298 RepID=A0ABS2L2P4_9MICO|nr:ATP-binding protein [Subtercola frigoramans]MBM7471171.1 hypothetical protein [Subtercola frigoramans]